MPCIPRTLPGLPDLKPSRLYLHHGLIVSDYYPLHISRHIDPLMRFCHTSFVQTSFCAPYDPWRGAFTTKIPTGCASIIFYFLRIPSSKLEDSSKIKNPGWGPGWYFCCGRYWIRTSDPLLVRHCLYVSVQFILFHILLYSCYL